MEGCFLFYPGIKWVLHSSAQRSCKAKKIKESQPQGGRIFRLKDPQDLRKLPLSGKTGAAKLGLIGIDNSEIIVTGPQELLDELSRRLSACAGKTLHDIITMRFEKDFLNCRNFKSGVCDPELRDIFEFRSARPGHDIAELDYAEADEICTNCKSFEPI